MYVMFPYGLQPSSSGLANQEHVLSPSIPHMIFCTVQTNTTGHTGQFQKLQLYHYKGLAYLQNGFLNHNLHVFCWTWLQYQLIYNMENTWTRNKTINYHLMVMQIAQENFENTPE